MGSVLVILITLLLRPLYSSICLIVQVGFEGPIKKLTWLWVSGRVQLQEHPAAFEVLCTKMCRLWFYLSFYCTQISSQASSFQFVVEILRDFSELRQFSQKSLHRFLVLALNTAYILAHYVKFFEIRTPSPPFSWLIGRVEASLMIGFVISYKKQLYWELGW